jgi:hypothetical protein
VISATSGGQSGARLAGWRGLGLSLVGALVLAAAGCGSPSSASPSPSPSPAEGARPAKTILADAAAAASTLRAHRIVFAGLDGDGQLQFDLTVDGRGNLSGTYTKHGVQGSIILFGTTLYVRGRDLVNAFNGQVLPPSYEGRWVAYASGGNGGLLGTLRRPGLLAQCLRDTAGTVSRTGTSQLDGQQVAVLDVAPSSGRADWELQVSVSLRNPPLPAEITIVASTEPPASCTGGAKQRVLDPSVPAAGTAGSVDIQPLSETPAVTAPPDALQLPSSGS